MEKKNINVHALTVHIYVIAIIVLVLLLLVLGAKYAHLKMAVDGYTKSAIYLNSQNQPDSQIGDYGQIISESIVMVPGSSLQKYVTDLSKNIKRYIVIVDKNKKVIASSMPASIGQSYNSDMGGEINMTFADGQVRTFEEKSANYPGGVSVLSIPVKNAQGQIINVVLVSNQKLSN